MSHQFGRVVSEILLRYFGEIVQQVGNDLFSYGSKPIVMIMKTTGLPRSQVIDSLRTLLKFDMASFDSSSNELIAEYKLIPENILLLIRYPRYLLEIKTKYGSIAELIVEEMLQRAISTITDLLVCLANKYKDDKDKNVTIVSLKDTYISLATAGYLQQAAVAELKEGSEVPTLVPVATIVPDLETRQLMLIMAGNAENTDNVYWKVNYERFHQDFRDELMIKAISRRIDDSAGTLLRVMLQQMYLCSAPTAAEGAPTAFAVLKDAVERGDCTALHTHLDQYLKVLEENGAGFVRRVGDASGGQYCVRPRHAASQLAAALLDHTVTERLGSKAARIFRLIRSKKYIEEEDIQKHAMLPNKECKELTYRLLEEHFISVQPMRKAASSGGLAKAIYLYHVKLHDTALCALEMCHRALHNVVRRGAHERRAHLRLLHKQRRVRSLVHGMRMRGEPQQNIDDVEETLTPPEQAILRGVERRLAKLGATELRLDEALFVLHWHLSYPH